MENHKSTEEQDQWLYVYDKNISLLDQTVCKTDDGYILGVLKQYTNDVYFGSNFFELSLIDKTINCHFKCKDRGLTQEVAEDRNKFISFMTNMEWNPPKTSTLHKIEKKSPFTDFTLFFIYDDTDNYKYCLLDSKKGSFKGCYNTEPSLEDLSVLKKSFETSFSNVITRENVAYSDIKIYHKSELGEKYE